MNGPLRSPGHVAADIEGRLVVSDTGNHRLLVGHMVGGALDVGTVVGRGEPGFEDGPLATAAFREPRGLAFTGDMVIVADRGNHAIRMVDLSAGRVATMAGTGRAAECPIPGGDPLACPLDSPWDVLLHEYDLFVAMVGTREVWRLDLGEGALALHAGGNGGGGAVAAPMALATDGESLYFADAGAASVRRMAFDGGPVETLADGGPADSGDDDPEGESGRLVRPAGLAWGQGNHRLWIADAGRHRLRTLDPASGRVETVEPFEAELDDPAGLASAGHVTFVADTNHHRILRVDQIDKRVVELAIEMP